MTSEITGRREGTLGKTDMLLALYERAVMNSPDLISIVDRNCVYRAVNKAYLKRYGKTEEEIVGRSVSDLLGPEASANIVRPNLDRCFAGEEVNYQEWFPYGDSGSSYMDVSYYPLPNDDGVIEYVAAVIRDISDNKRAEEALRESEERYRSLIENANDAIITVDLATGKVTGSNSFTEEALRYTKQQILDLSSWLDLIHPDDRPAIMGALGQYLADGTRHPNFPFRALRSDGTFLHVEQNAALILDREGKPHSIVAIARDVTERKRMEEALRASEARYHNLFEHSPIAICEVDFSRVKTFVEDLLRSGVSDIKAYCADNPDAVARCASLIETLDVNQAALELYDATSKDFLRDGLNMILGEEGIDGFVDALVAVANNEMRFETENINQTLTGRRKYVAIRSYAVPGHEETLSRVLVSIVDVTDRKRMEEALQESEEKTRALLDSCIDSALLVDKSGLILTLNETAAARLGRSVEELIGANVNDILPPDVAERRWETGKKVLETKRPVRSEDERGGLIFDSNYYPVFGRDGEVARLAIYARDITEEKRAKEKLQRSTERYRDIFWEAPDIFFTMDIDTWIITDANRYALEALEYGPERIGNIHVSELIHPDDYEKAAKRLRDMVAHGDRMPHFPLRILSRTGKSLHIEQSGVVFNDARGRPKTFLGLAHDVTEVRLQQDMVQRRNERLSALYQVAAAANESLDLKLRIGAILEVVSGIANSPTMAILLFDESTQRFRYLANRGLPEEIVSATDNMPADSGIHGLLFRDRTPLLIPDINAHSLLSRPGAVNQLEIGSVIAVPLVVRDKLLGSMWVSRKPGFPFADEEFKLITAIGNHVATAIENAGLYAQVVEREAHLQSILETSRDGIAVLNQSRRAVFRNSAMSSIFGYDDSDDLSGLDTREYFAPESYGILKDIRRRLAAGHSVDELIKFKAKRKDGTTFDAEARLGHFMEKEDRFDVVVLRDMTDRNRMDFQLQQSNKLAAIGELAAGVAHEINNPIATVQVQTGLMRDIVSDEQTKIDQSLLTRLEEILDTIEDQVERCQSVTNSLLSFSRVPEGKEGTCDVNRLVERTVRFVSNLMDRSSAIDVALDECGPSCPGDPHRLEQVFVNLLTNACKAAGRDGAVAISTRLESSGTVSIEFADSGPGIPESVRRRIFDPFFTTNTKDGGTGLGLSISHYIIQGMDGTIAVDSTLGQGSKFTVVLHGAGGLEERRNDVS